MTHRLLHVPWRVCYTVYMFLGQSYQRQQRHQLDGVVKLAAVPAAAAAGATLHDAVAAAATPAREPSSIKMSVAPGQDELCQDTCFKVLPQRHACAVLSALLAVLSMIACLSSA